jgi:hypothetical protein
LRQAAAHREGRLRQEDGVAVVAASGGIFAGVSHEVSFRRLGSFRLERRSALEIPASAGLQALRRYAGRLIEIGRNRRTSMAPPV